MKNETMRSATKYVLELNQVGRQFGSDPPVHALVDVDLRVQPGEWIAVTGPSGAGKSTLLNIIGCLDQPTGGQYLLEGQDVGVLDDNALSEFRLRHLGFIFQSFNLIPQLTLRENIELPLYYLGWDAHASAERAAELAHRDRKSAV